MKKINIKISKNLIIGYCDISYSSIRVILELKTIFEKKYSNFEKEEIKFSNFFTEKDEKKKEIFKYEDKKLSKFEIISFFNKKEDVEPEITLLILNFKIKDNYILHFINQIFLNIINDDIKIFIPSSCDIYNSKNDFFILNFNNNNNDEKFNNNDEKLKIKENDNEKIILKDNFLNHFITFSKIKNNNLTILIKKGKKINKIFKKNFDDGTEQVNFILFLIIRILYF
jgi:hypothetical protein